MVKIIIQERDNNVANVLRILLSQEGYYVLTIKNPDSLRALIPKFKPDLILIESLNAEKETPRILEYLKKKSGIKIIATTCGENRLDLVDKLGFDECLDKPFNNEQLIKVIQSTLSKSIHP